MGGQPLGNLFSSGILDKWDVTSIYSKYKWIIDQINLLCTRLYLSWRWCVYINVDWFIHMSWCKHSIIGYKVKQVTSCTKARNWKLVWSSKDCPRKGGLSSISSWILFILHKRLIYLNLCWLLCNSLTQTRDNHIIDRITQEWPWKYMLIDKVDTSNYLGVNMESKSRKIQMGYSNYLHRIWWRK